MRFVALYAVLALAAAIGVSAQVVSDPVVTNNGCFCQAPGCTIPGIPDVEENRSCNVTDECFLGSGIQGCGEPFVEGCICVNQTFVGPGRYRPTHEINCQIICRNRYSADGWWASGGTAKPAPPARSRPTTDPVGGCTYAIYDLARSWLTEEIMHAVNGVNVSMKEGCLCCDGEQRETKEEPSAELCASLCSTPTGFIISTANLSTQSLPRPGHFDTRSATPTSPPIGIIVGATLGGIAFLGIIVGAGFYVANKKKKASAPDGVDWEAISGKGQLPPDGSWTTSAPAGSTFHSNPATATTASPISPPTTGPL